MRDKPNVIVIGAGMAGLAAAKKLLSNHYNVTILEARDRIGGRTWTNDSLGVPLDLGAFLIHGIDHNPMTQLAHQFNIKIRPVDLNTIHFANSQQPISAEQLAAVDVQYKKLLASARDYAHHAKNDIPLSEAMKASYHANEYPLLNNHFYALKSSFLALYFGADNKYLSARHWDEDEIILEGGNYFMLNGYKPLVTGLAKEIPIILNTSVTHIRYAERTVKITTNNGDYEADAVIITVPLGVLKNKTISFEPALPIIKQQSITRLGMGVLNKIALRFPRVFWPSNYLNMTDLAANYATISWFINYDYLFKQPVLVGTVGGDVAHDFEKRDDKTICKETMDVLRQLFGNAIPNPTAFFITRWAQDPYSFGSYSYIPVGANGNDYDVLSQPINNKLYFAGEATQRNFFATTHGAYLSGIREAERIMQDFK